MFASRHHAIQRSAPAAGWIEGIPCGNGTLGAMAYGGADSLVFSLDRSDLWCKTPDLPRRRMTAGTLALHAPAATRFLEGLDLEEAVAFRDTGRSRIAWFVHAELPLLCIRIRQSAGRLRFDLNPPDLWSRGAADRASYARRAGGASREGGNPYLGRTRTRLAVEGHSAILTFALDGAERLRTRVRAFRNGCAWPVRREGRGVSLATRGADEILLLADVTLPAGGGEAPPEPSPRWTALLKDHRRWWARFWAASSVRVSSPGIQRLWRMAVYQLGSNCPKNGRPMPLQGVWGAEGMPPWNGAYTWDLNVQACYWPIYAGNRLELGCSLYDWYRDRLPCWREYARAFPNARGAALVLQTDDDGVSPFNARHTTSPAHGAWVCHNFWQHYTYTQDTGFLRSHCLPVFRDHLEFARSLWKKGSDGRFHLRHAASPELSLLASRACPCRDSAYEIAGARFLAGAWIQTAGILGIAPDRLLAWAKDFLANLVAYPTASTTASNYYWPEEPETPEFFVEWPGLETQMSHRHFSHLMMLHPFGEIHRFSPPRTLRIARNSLHMLILRGQGAWAGFSFPWASLLATRAGWPPRMASHMLETFLEQVVVPFNGLTLNEDHRRLGTINQTGPFGPFHLQNFTLESAMIALAAVQELILHPAGKHLVFCGGTPPEFDGEFRGFRTPFGDTVSGRFENGRLVSAELTASRSASRTFALDDLPTTWRVSGARGAARWPDRPTVCVKVRAGETLAFQRG